MPTPEWLRPVSERFLGGDPGPPPRPVRVAAVLSAGCAAATGAMVAIWAPMIFSPRETQWWWMTAALNFLVAGGLAATGLVLCAVFAAGTVMLSRRGWFRPLHHAGLVLGCLAAIGLCVSAPPRTVPDAEPDVSPADWATTGVGPPLAAAAALAFGLVLVLRTSSAQTWLAKRRYQRRQLTGSTRG